VTLLLIILLVLLIAGGGWGYSAGYHTSPYGILWVLVLVILLVLLFGAPRLGYW
jgi:hypothetical protein